MAEVVIMDEPEPDDDFGATAFEKAWEEMNKGLSRYFFMKGLEAKPMHVPPDMANPTNKLQAIIQNALVELGVQDANSSLCEKRYTTSELAELLTPILARELNLNKLSEEA